MSLRALFLIERRPMRTNLKSYAAFGLVAVFGLNLSACSPESGPSTEVDAAVLTVSDEALRVVAWNVEHLAAPIDTGCRPRSEDELVALQAYARGLDADVVALQEVASLEAVALLFPEEDWQLFLSERPDSDPYECRGSGNTSTQQKLAFAVANDIEVLSQSDFDELGLDSPGLRHGMELAVSTPLGDIELLNVHMKSGCFVDDFSRADSDACETFERQAPILDGWIEEKEASTQPYIILGDFNHRLSAPYNQMTRLMSDNTDGSSSSLVIATADMIGCHPWYPAPIDHIVFGNMQDPALMTSVKAHDFDNMDPDAMLSDHCAISMTMEYGQLPLTNSVTWQTASKEYAFLTTSIYEEAEETLRAMSLPETPWAVVMDVDETVLDNSAYQVGLDQTGRSFTPASWAEWVASEQARLVPGVSAFIDTVFELDGRVAFVTNRDRPQDNHTWSNMLTTGLPVTADNACLMGRSAADESSVDDRTRFNDKDLRRQQVEDGSSSCFNPDGGRHSDFPASTIIMHIGDNIEDFPGVTQETADVQALMAENDGQYVLLPNPMYGSW